MLSFRYYQLTCGLGFLGLHQKLMISFLTFFFFFFFFFLNVVFITIFLLFPIIVLQLTLYDGHLQMSFRGFCLLGHTSLVC